MTSTDTYEQVAAQLRRPPASTTRDDDELIRLATLAASSHNTQPWAFAVEADAITIEPDRSRRCPVVDPDDAHLYRSLGCAAENLAQAATTQGLRADVTFDPARDLVVARLTPAPEVAPSPLAAAILTRQCTRAEYDGNPLAEDQLVLLGSAGTVGRARCVLVTDADQLRAVDDHVHRGNLAQLRDAPFRGELLRWIRFNPRTAVRSGDGLAGRASGQPPVPTPIGRLLAPLLLRASKQAELDRERLASAAGVAVIVTAEDDRPAWVDAGRAFQRFALQAELLDVRTAFINQPIEVAELRPSFAGAVGLGDEHAQLAIRFGHGPKLPFSLRRPGDEVVR